MMEGVISFIGVGSNMDDPPRRCLEAIHRLSFIDGVRFLRRASLYRTEPVGSTDQDWFVNTVAEIRTVLAPRNLFSELQAVEIGMGRVRKGKGEPRRIDLDILLFGQEVIQDSDLVIPHAALHKRRFVLVPLCEIASCAIHPAFGVSVRGLMERLEDDKAVHVYREIES